MGLFMPTWKSKNEKRALKMLSKITDQSKLAKAVSFAPLLSVRLEAVQKIDDQQLLLEIVKELNDKNGLENSVVLNKIIEKSDHLNFPVLQELSKSKYSRIRLFAFEKLGNWQNVRVEKDKIEKYNYLSVLERIFNNQNGFSILRNTREIESISNSDLLADIYDKADWKIKEAAMNNPNFPKEKLIDIAKKAKDKSWSYAVLKIKDREILSYIAISRLHDIPVKFNELIEYDCDGCEHDENFHYWNKVRRYLELPQLTRKELVK
ncbi:MAG: hypothetical protein LBL90_08515 [Prevotellaceae bacterium]|jgi:hypothetical protein|nr:hypothetical protein [Prevotellaceae bacterium]